MQKNKQRINNQIVEDQTTTPKPQTKAIFWSDEFETKQPSRSPPEDQDEMQDTGEAQNESVVQDVEKSVQEQEISSEAKQKANQTGETIVEITKDNLAHMMSLYEDLSQKRVVVRKSRGFRKHKAWMISRLELSCEIAIHRIQELEFQSLCDFSSPDSEISKELTARRETFLKKLNEKLW